MQKVIIIGAGIAGLSAGVYAAQSGFDVTVLEQHTIPGGFCTSWRRKGYLFEGGLHWLSGSSDKQPLNKVWRNVGAINDDTKVILNDPFMTFEHQGQQVSVYRDIEKTRRHWLSISPEDKTAINKFCNDIKHASGLVMPVTDIRGVKVKEKSRMKLSALHGMLHALFVMMKYIKISTVELGARFKNPALRAMLGVAGEEYAAFAPLFTFGAVAANDGGYLEGGSLKMAQNMADRFTSLGGKIQYKTKVEQVVVENGKAVGVMANNEKLTADSVIVTTDTIVAIDRLFVQPLNESWTEKVRALKPKVTANTFISIGVEADLSDLPHSMAFTLDKPFAYADKEDSSMGFNHYAGYDGYAPEGCTAMTVILGGDTYDFWEKCKDNGAYEDEKKKTADAVIGILSEKIPQIKDKIAVVDVATPLTYERYCGSYHGSWMTTIHKGEKMRSYPLKSESVRNLYFAGQRMSPPGGMPPAVETGRKAVQYLCKDAGVVFQGFVL